MSRYARCLIGSYGCWAEEVSSGQVLSTTVEWARLPLQANSRFVRFFKNNEGGPVNIVHAHFAAFI